MAADGESLHGLILPQSTGRSSLVLPSLLTTVAC
eukprot:UN06258